MPPIPLLDVAGTGLTPVLSKINVPAGKFGRYVCTNPEYGIDKGPSEYLNVLCRNDSTYDTAPNTEWPTCRERTTTIRPGQFFRLSFISRGVPENRAKGTGSSTHRNQTSLCNFLPVVVREE
jgi:hypothetical protein